MTEICTLNARYRDYTLHSDGTVTYGLNCTYNKPIRFFHYDIDDNDDLDIVEIDLDTFKGILAESDYGIDLERNTVFENGVEQLCFTIRDI